MPGRLKGVAVPLGDADGGGAAILPAPGRAYPRRPTSRSPPVRSLGTLARYPNSTLRRVSARPAPVPGGLPPPPAPGAAPGAAARRLAVIPCEP